jgi:uncharacterized membrane protein YkgB
MSVPKMGRPRSEELVATAPSSGSFASMIRRVGRVLALAGVEALKPLVAPWLAWMYAAFGEAGASYLLGGVEITTALLLLASAWVPRAGVIGGALATLIFLTTTSLLFAMPIWEPAADGFPALSGAGQFLLKDVALLGVSLVVLGESTARIGGSWSI